jgi:hypothetical protein
MAVEVDARWEPMGAQEYYDYWWPCTTLVATGDRSGVGMAEDVAAS